MVPTPLQSVLRQVCGLGAENRSDGELLRAFTRGEDSNAFALLLKRHSSMVLAVCRRVLQQLQDAEDAFQATFLLLARNSHAIGNRESAAGWLHETAYRMAQNARRARLRRQRHEGRARTMRPANPVWEATWREVQVVLDDELRRLPAVYREVFVLCSLENRSAAQAAKILCIQEGTVRSRLSRARARLQQALRRRGVSLTAVLAAAGLVGGTATARASMTLISSTLHAASQVAAGKTLTTAVVSATVTELLQRGNSAMILTKVKTTALVVLLLALPSMGAYQYVAAGGLSPLPRLSDPVNQPPSASQTAGRSAGTEVATRVTAQTIQIHGRVLNPEGAPLVGAELCLRASARQTVPFRARSGPDGRFAFRVARTEFDPDNPQPLAYQLLAVAKGYGCAWVTSQPTAEELTLRLVPDLVVAGRILDAEGKAVVGATLTVTGVADGKGDKGWTGPLPGQPAALTTAGDGGFQLSGTGRGRVVKLRLEGTGIASAELDVKGTPFEYQAAVSRPIEGMVCDKGTGKPLADVEVSQKSGLCKTVTDQQGRYQLLGVAKAPSYTLVVKPPDGLHFQRELPLQDTPGLEALPCNVELEQGSILVTGKVKDKATGKPLAGALVAYNPVYPNDTATKMSAGSYPESKTTTAQDGSYTLRVMPGAGVLCVAGPDLDAYMQASLAPQDIKAFFKAPVEQGTLTIDLGGGTRMPLLGQYNALVLLEPDEQTKTLEKDIALDTGGERHGRVVGPDGKPLAGALIGGLGLRVVVRGADFVVRGINLGQRRPLLFLHKEKSLGFYLKALPDDKADPLVIKLQPCGSISGRLLDVDGQPMANFRFGLAAAGGLVGVYTTDKDGRFHLQGLVPGLMHRLENPQAGAMEIASTVVQSGKATDLGDLHLSE
jgi:RNA polymerase sigma factor (sigma-70 family)